MNSPLVNLAMLETIRARKSGYFLDHFVSFLAVALSSNNTEELSLDDAKALLEREFGIILPYSSAKLILSRACKKGILKKGEVLYTRIYEQCEKIASQFKSRKQDIIASQKKLFLAFISFAKDRHELELNEADAETIFADYLQKYQLDVVNFESPKAILEYGHDIKNVEYLVCSFITELHQNKDQIFNDLEKVIRGYLVANYVNLKGTESERAHLKGTIVVLDTPLLMGLGGFNGKIRADSCQQMIQLGQSLGISFVVFEHIYEEWESIFHAWINDLRNRNFKAFNSSTLALLQAKGFDASAIETMIPRLKSNLEKVGIKIVDRPTFNPAFVLDESNLYEHLKQSGLSETNNRLDRDIQSIAAVYSLRKGRARMSFQEQPAILVTSNGSLIRETLSFFKKDFSEKSIPLLCSELWLTNICWMLNPDLFPELPRRLMVANCYSTMYADDKFWDSFLNRLRRLKGEGKISSDDYRLVRYEVDLKHCMKEISVTGGVDIQDEEILNAVKMTKEKIMKEKDVEITSLKARHRGITDNLQTLSQKIAKVLSWTCMFMISVGIIIVPLLSWKYQASLEVLTVSIFVAAAGTWFDFSLWNRRKSLEMFLANNVNLKIHSFLNVAHVSEQRQPGARTISS